MIHIALVDDHKVFREGVNLLLAQNPDFQVVGGAGNRDELDDILSRQTVDVLLMDINLGGEMQGIAIVADVLLRYPSIRVIAFTMHDEKTYVVRMLEAGASGYLLKNAGKEELFSAVHAVACGDSYFSHEISALLLRQFTKNHQPDSQEHKKGIPLTTREIQVLRLITEEYSNPEIAEKLFISPRTVDSHRRNLLEKLGVKNTAGLVKYALQHQLLD